LRDASEGKVNAASQQHIGGREPHKPGGDPLPGLAAFWSAQRPDLLGFDAPWDALSGGRTNAVWQVTTVASTLVVKLYRPGAATPVFANDPDAEAASLAALAGTGLAPDLVAEAATPFGRSLVYRLVAGRSWHGADDPVLVAQALAQVHDSPPPPGLPLLAPTPQRLRAQSYEMLAELGSKADALARAEPGDAPGLPNATPVFIHGDATAANALVTGTGLTFIDWQCPACSDAADDLAVFLSPAMQMVSGNAPLTPQREALFLDAYRAARGRDAGNKTVARYRALAPLYHWRMAVYAVWRSARGEAEYTAAAERELASLRAAAPPAPR
jgi:Ser/Thr protein kinase RdoA (MazF antagonist)